MGLFRRRRTAVLPEDAVAVLERRFAHWRRLDDDERSALLDRIQWLLEHKRWEAARGFELDDAQRVLLAAQAGLLLLGLGVEHARLVTTFIVHPTSTFTEGERHTHVPGTVTDDPVAIDGLAEDGFGPVIVAWDAAADAARHPGRGYDVVVHEVAHKIDMLDGLVDGTPSMDGAARDRWRRACQPVYEAMVDGIDRPPLDPYGAEDPAEFFAVASEAFLCQPAALLANEPELYAALREFYGQDPARRLTRRPRPPGA